MSGVPGHGRVAQAEQVALGDGGKPGSESVVGADPPGGRDQGTLAAFYIIGL